MAALTIAASINYGASLRIGYRFKASSSPFTYVPSFPTAAELPFTITGLASGNYEVELLQICPNCGGGIYSDPIIIDALTV